MEGALYPELSIDTGIGEPGMPEFGFTVVSSDATGSSVYEYGSVVEFQKSQPVCEITFAPHVPVKVFPVWQM